LSKPYAIEGKPLIAHYLFTKDFKNNMTIDELCKLVSQSIYDTMAIDGDVGGKIRLAIIDDEGIRELSDSDTKNYINEWQNKNTVRIL
jgi:20S proteasome alpha/beta subunit